MSRLARLLALLALAIGPAAAVAQAPDSWTAGLPVAGCPGGEPECVDQVARALSRHVEQLDCSHNAIFAFAYRRITERVAEAMREAGFFVEPSYIGRFDVAFAREYGDQWDAWTGARIGPVAPAWRIALDAARARHVTANGNLLLALNAHIGRDMPIVLERVGLARRDGSSRKPDQDRVDAILQAALRPLLTELADRYDPTTDDGDLPGADDDALLYRSVQLLRERAWRLAQQLDAAGADPLARTIVLAQIEQEARARALALATLTAYPPVSDGAAVRDAYCAAPRG
jgi:hypothetical protein